jgi:hypothetical protein
MTFRFSFSHRLEQRLPPYVLCKRMNDFRYRIFRSHQLHRLHTVCDTRVKKDNHQYITNARADNIESLVVPLMLPYGNKNKKYRLTGSPTSIRLPIRGSRTHGLLDGLHQQPARMQSVTGEKNASQFRRSPLCHDCCRAVRPRFVRRMLINYTQSAFRSPKWGVYECHAHHASNIRSTVHEFDIIARVFL